MRCPDPDAVAGYVTVFAEIMCGLGGDRLGDWIARWKPISSPDLRPFTAGLKRDLDAVVNGLSPPYSSGAVQGAINRIKMLKRQMYGRASFDLLRNGSCSPHDTATGSGRSAPNSFGFVSRPRWRRPVDFTAALLTGPRGQVTPGNRGNLRNRYGTLPVAQGWHRRATATASQLRPPAPPGDRLSKPVAPIGGMRRCPALSTDVNRAGQNVHVDRGHVAGDGGSVYYETAWTDHSGPAIVLTHDGLLHRETWDAQFTTFAHHYRVARWDRRGYGRSPAPQAPFSSVDDLARVVRAVSDAPATLIGCSFGSLVTLHCTLDHPQLVRALVLVGPIVSGLGYSGHFLTRGGHQPPALDAPVATQLEYWTTADPWIVAAGNDTARQRLRALLAANPHNLRPAVELERRPASPALQRLKQLSVPTLILVGEADIPDVHAHSGAIEAGIRGARRVVLPGSGHLPHLEVPDAFNRVVLEFLDSHANHG